MENKIKKICEYCKTKFETNNCKRVYCRKECAREQEIINQKKYYEKNKLLYKKKYKEYKKNNAEKLRDIWRKSSKKRAKYISLYGKALRELRDNHLDEFNEIFDKL